MNSKLCGSVAAAIDPTRERAFWDENFSGPDFADVEAAMSSARGARLGTSSLSWTRAQHAARDAWNRISVSG